MKKWTVIAAAAFALNAHAANELKIGVKIYDLLCSGRNLGKSTWLGRDEVREKVPALTQTNLNGAVRYYDGFTNDARLTLDTLRSAAKSGTPRAPRPSARARAVATIASA